MSDSWVMLDAGLRPTEFMAPSLVALQADRAAPSVAVGEEGPPVPKLEGGDLAAGVAYPATSGPPAWLYLPRYELATVNGTYALRLRLRRPEDPPGIAGVMSVGVRGAALDPSIAGAAPAEHQVIARLKYALPVRAAAGGATVSAAGVPCEFELGPCEPSADGTRRAEASIAEERELEELYRALTDPAYMCRLQLLCSVPAARTDWWPIFLTPPPDEPMLIRPDLQFMRQGVPVVEPTLGAPNVELMPADRVVDAGRLRAIGPRTAGIARPALSPELRASVSPRSFRPTESDEVLGAAEAPVARSLKRPGDGESIVIGDGMGVPPKPVSVELPIDGIRDMAGEPVAARYVAVVEQIVDPFCFSGPDYRPLFPEGFAPPAAQLLLAEDALTPDGQSLRYYRDPARPGRCYYEPAEFRLGWVGDHDALPDLQIAPVAIALPAGTPGADQTADYRTLVAFRAIPHIDARDMAVLDSDAAATCGCPADLIALEPSTSTLTLRLPDDTGHLVDTARPAASVAFASGLADQLDLALQQLHLMMPQLAAEGVLGSVRAALVADQNADVPVRLSFARPAGQLLALDLVSADKAHATFTAHNPLSMPVRVAGVQPTAVGPGAVLTAADHALTAAPIAPGATVTFALNLMPVGGATVAQIAAVQPQLTFAVEVDLDALLPKLLRTTGYVSDHYTVAVSTDPAYFATPAGPAPLAALRASFASDPDGADVVVVVLTATTPAATVTLGIPLARFLSGAQDAKRFSVRVENLAADGSVLVAGPWTSVEGDAPLEIRPAGA